MPKIERPLDTVVEFGNNKGLQAKGPAGGSAFIKYKMWLSSAQVDVFDG